MYIASFYRLFPKKIEKPYYKMSNCISEVILLIKPLKCVQ